MMFMDGINPRFKKWFSFQDFNYIQKQCLPTILRTDENVVVSAPTGAGKTTIFELAMIRAIERGLDGKIVYLAPMRALCTEKLAQWKAKLAELNLQCVDYSDDCAEESVLDAHVIICTPEKLEFNSRTEKTHWSKNIQLVMIDEVHFLNCERGAALEALISRLRRVLGKCRFVAVSATIPNVGTVALWLRDLSTRQPAKILKFPDSMRPIPLRTQVIGCYRGEKSAFDFEFGLSFRLADLIKKHSDNKQTLIFCSTRQSTEKTAEILSQKLPTTPVPADFESSKLNFYTKKSGVGFHHAGLSPEDRDKVECLFRENKIKVLCATSTLAVGVNLPARLVIIKSTLKYSDNGFHEYDELEVRQMIGRAGRAGFDTEGIALILTDTKTQGIYKNISEGRVEVKSNLDKDCTANYLNIEIAAQRIKTIDEAHNWFSNTFRAAENKSNLKETESQMQVVGAINELVEATLIQVSNSEIVPSPLSSAVAKNFISIKSFKYFNLHLNSEVSEDIGCLLQILCACPDSIDRFRFRKGDKQHLLKIAAESGIRFPLQGTKLTETWKKIFLLLQVNMQSELIDALDHLPSNLKSEAQAIGEFIHRLLKFTGEFFWKKGLATAFLNVLELQSAIAGESWPDDSKLLQQVNSIGRVYAGKLFSAGICDLNDLADCEESRIEILCGRNPPFGHKVKVNINEKFPKLGLSADFNDDLVVCNGSIAGKEETIHLLVIASIDGISQILHYELFQKRQVFMRSIKIPTGKVQSVSCSLLTTLHAGCNRHVTFKLAEPNPKPAELSKLKPSIESKQKTPPRSKKAEGPAKIVPIGSLPVAISPLCPETPPAKRSVPSPISSEKSVKSKRFLGNRNMTLSSAQSFLQKYAPVNTPPIRSSLFLPKVSVQQTIVDEIEIELRSLDD